MLEHLASLVGSRKGKGNKEKVEKRAKEQDRRYMGRGRGEGGKRGGRRECIMTWLFPVVKNII